VGANFNALRIGRIAAGVTLKRPFRQRIDKPRPVRTGSPAHLARTVVVSVKDDVRLKITRRFGNRTGNDWIKCPLFFININSYSGLGRINLAITVGYRAGGLTLPASGTLCVVDQYFFHIILFKMQYVNSSLILRPRKKRMPYEAAVK
jgi:hypothetical protein